MVLWGSVVTEVVVLVSVLVVGVVLGVVVLVVLFGSVLGFWGTGLEVAVGVLVLGSIFLLVSCDIFIISCFFSLKIPSFSLANSSFNCAIFCKFLSPNVLAHVHPLTPIAASVDQAGAWQY